MNGRQENRTVEAKADEMLEGGEKEHSKLHGQVAGTKESQKKIETF